MLSRWGFAYAGGTGVVRGIMCVGTPFIAEYWEVEVIVETLAESVGSEIAKLAWVPRCELC